MDAEVMYSLLAFGAFFGLMGFLLGRLRGNGGAGFWLGFLLGPLGVIVAVLLPGDAPNKKMKCPACGTASGDSRLCKGCGAMLKKKRHVPQMVDPVDEWERREKSGKKLPPIR